MSLFNVTLEEAARVLPYVVGLETGRYVVTAGLASLIVWAFWNAGLKARKIQARNAQAADLRREIATSLRTALVFAAVGFCMFLAKSAGWLTIYDDFAVRGPVYFAVTLVLMVVAHDAWYYWTHRAMHHPRLFRAFHWTHHKSKTPTPWTSTSRATTSISPVASFGFTAPPSRITTSPVIVTTDSGRRWSRIFSGLILAAQTTWVSP